MLRTLVSCLCIAACDPGVTSDCGPGEVRLDVGCYHICDNSNDCGAGAGCYNGVCVPGQQPPEILGVDGDGSLDPGGTHRIDHRLIIDGRNLLGADVQLIDADGNAAAIALADAGDTQLVVCLPAEMAEGTYTLRVANQAGECATSVPVLRGETGASPWALNGSDATFEGGHVAIGTDAPAATLHVVRADLNGPVAVLERVGAAGANLILRRANGTTDAPTAIVAGDYIGNIHFRGYEGAAFSLERATIRVGATQDWTATTGGAYMAFLTAPDDTWTPLERLRIDQDGDVGIGTATVGNILTIAQGSLTDPIADAWTVYSSRRWKTDIAPIEDALGKVQRLRGVTYRWKSDGRRDVGFIAEEAGAVLPEIVAYEANGTDARSMDYARVSAVLVEAVKAQQAQLAAQSQALATLQGDYARLAARLERLETGRSRTAAQLRR